MTSYKAQHKAIFFLNCFQNIFREINIAYPYIIKETA